MTVASTICEFPGHGAHPYDVVAMLFVLEPKKAFAWLVPDAKICVDCRAQVKRGLHARNYGRLKSLASL